MLFNVIYTIGNNENQDLIIIDAPEDFPLIGRECPELKTYIRACHHDLPMIDEIDILRIFEVYRHKPNIAPTAPAAISTSSLPGVRMIRYWKSGIWTDGPIADYTGTRILSVPAGADDVYIQKTVQNAITEWKEEGIINKISSTPSRAAQTFVHQVDMPSSVGNVVDNTDGTAFEPVETIKGDFLAMAKVKYTAHPNWACGHDVYVKNELTGEVEGMSAAEARALANDLLESAQVAEAAEMAARKHLDKFQKNRKSSYYKSPSCDDVD